jgi:plasmid stabilization system protein ParE
MEDSGKFAVIVSGRAAQMMTEHAAFLARVSKQAAQRLTDSFTEAADSLSFMPYRCPWFIADFIPRNTYRFLIFEKRYLMLYQVQDQNVYIDFILDCRQDYGWLLK